MTAKVALAEPAPVEERGSVLRQAQDSMRERIANLDPQGKNSSGSNKLLQAVETLASPASEVAVRQRAVRVIKHRLVMLRQVTTSRLSSTQERDTLIILLFVNSRMREVVGERQDACALLALKGSDSAKELICNVFPGLSTAFDV